MHLFFLNFRYVTPLIQFISPNSAYTTLHNLHIPHRKKCIQKHKLNGACVFLDLASKAHSLRLNRASQDAPSGNASLPDCFFLFASRLERWGISDRKTESSRKRPFPDVSRVPGPLLRAHSSYLTVSSQLHALQPLHHPPGNRQHHTVTHRRFQRARVIALYHS